MPALHDITRIKVHALVRGWLFWTRHRCQAHNGGLAHPPNQMCADLHAVSNLFVCHLLKVASHANVGAAVDTLQSWVLLMFLPTLRDSSRRGAGLPTQKTTYVRQAPLVPMCSLATPLFPCTSSLHPVATHTQPAPCSHAHTACPVFPGTPNLPPVAWHTQPAP